MDTGQTALVTNLTAAPRGMTWSPDGRWLAFVMAVRGDSKPLAKPMDKPDGAEWAKPARLIDRVVYRSDGAGYLELEYTHLFAVPAEGGTPRQLTTGDFNDDPAFSWSPDGAAIVFSSNRNDDWELDPVEDDIWSVDIATGALTQLTHRNGVERGPVVSPDGRLIAFQGFEDNLHGYQGASIHLIDRDGANMRVLAGDLDRDVRNLAWAGDGSGLFVEYQDRGDTVIAFASAHGGGAPEVRATRVGGNEIGRPYAGGAWSVAHDGTIAFTIASPGRPADVAIAARAGRQARRLTALNEDLLAHKRLGAVRELTWKSSFDQREIQGWLVTPPDFDPAKKHPLLLEIHGGPFAAYGPTFAAEIQLYAAAGYVVLYCNPRGSTGYGDAFANLIHHNYPGQDFDDLMAGVDAVIAGGHADPDGLFVTGGSGGGVLTAWIVGSTVRFRAAAVVKPVINWTSFSLTSDNTPFFYKYWFGAAPWEDPQSYWRRSPLSLVGRVTTPTLLVVGEADYRTPVSETEQFYQALKLRGIDTAMVRIPDSPHHIAARPSNLVAKVDNILAWFARYRSEGADQER
jgi:dipeptidyl aminopeptidase/acylaminoacyl peptidase